MKSVKPVQRVAKRKTTACPIKKRRLNAIQTVNFLVMGDSHVGFGNSLSIYKRLLQQAVKSGHKSFCIFGGDNKHGSTGTQATTDYKAFKNVATGILGPKHIPFKASIGNWEDNTRAQFKQFLGDVMGKMDFPGTQGKVKYVWLDNAPGKFSFASIDLLTKLDPNFYYIIDCHWPLKVNGITVDPSHVLDAQETAHFFHAIPANVRDKVLAIFTHHAHTFYQNLSHIYPGFNGTQFYVCGCSGDYECKCDTTGCGRGYYEGVLTLNNGKASLKITPVES
ncbi:metallophosphoesterase [Paenibacillus sp. RUD330]|nr:metallophosphoesterase [Paenibacillus sp. RUD330]